MNHPRRCRIVAPTFSLLILVLPGFAMGDGRHSADESLFSATQYLERVTYLASDELEGRESGEEGIYQAAEYIASVFEDYGIQPAGDDGTYFQEFTLKLKSTIGPDTRLAIGTHGRRSRRPVDLHEDYVPLPFSNSGAFKGDVVFAGYGIVSDDLDYNDYEGIEVTGNIVLMFRRAPDFEEFGWEDMSFRQKASRARDRDAAAILFVNRVDDEEADELYKFEGGRGGHSRFGRTSFGIPMLHITQETANMMLETADLPNLATLQEQIEDTEEPASAPMEGVSVSGFVQIDPLETPVRNVVGLIPGTGANADEVIVLGAHYDHLGVQNKGQADFDPQKHIFNGADDNASGTAMVMTLAEAYTQGPPPNRSILLAAFTAEEKGLIGSRYFVDHPTVDLDKCAAMLNFDMVGRLRDDKLEVVGMDSGGFRGMVERLAEPYNLKVKGGPFMQGDSDHSSFSRRDIPVMFFFTGLHKQYHRPTDDSELINTAGAMRIAKLAADCIDEIDARTERPEFRTEEEAASNVDRSDDEDQQDDDDAGAAWQGRVHLGIYPDSQKGRGVRVAKVSKDSPAQRAGLQKGDRIMKLGDTDIDDLGDLRSALEGFKDGDETTVVVRRKKKTTEMTIRFGEAQTAGAGHDNHAVAETVAATIRKSLQAWGPETECAIRVDNGEQAVELVMTSTDLAGLLDPEGPGGGAGAVLGFLQDSFPGGSGTFNVSIVAHTTSEGVAVESILKFEFEIASDPSAPADQAAPAGDRDDDDQTTDPKRPPVRLGIIPARGESPGPGLAISRVVEGGPADRAGIKDTDRLYKIGKHKVTNLRECLNALRQFTPGDEVTIIVIRDGKKTALTVTTKAARPKKAA
jgi:membrane-associated protease RseP (regulator of RpoE activity)